MVVYPVTIKDTSELERRLKEDLDISSLLSKDMAHNSSVIFELMKYSERVLTNLKDLTNQDKKKIADSVAYFMRPDFIKGRRELELPFIPRYVESTDNSPRKTKVHLANDPLILTPDWTLNKESSPDFNVLSLRGAELFRCYLATISYAKNMAAKLDSEGNSHSPAFKLADTTAYLIVPEDLRNYKYTEEEKRLFDEEINKINREEFYPRAD